MQDPAEPTPTSGLFATLRPRRRRVAVPPGCLTMVGGPLMAVGFWLIGVAVVFMHGDPAARAQIIIGSAVAVVGLAVFAVRMRQTFGALTPVPEVALERGQRLSPGAIVPMRLRLRATARLSRLKVTLVCERRYVEQVTSAGTMSVSTAERVETLTTQDLFEVTGISLNRRIPWEETASVVVPYLAKPSGPVLPSGTAEWFIDVLVEPALGKPVHDRYDLLVVLSDAPETALQPGNQTAFQPPASDTSLLANLGPAVGCAVIALAFLLVGPIFLWLYFSDAATKRGNPIMGLFAGILFTGLGLAGVSALLRRQPRHRPDNWKRRTHDPRRLP